NCEMAALFIDLIPVDQLSKISLEVPATLPSPLASCFYKEMQDTVSHQGSSWMLENDSSSITLGIHHCFVIDFIGKDLTNFKNSKQLMQ
ncbi:hypothetical protein C0995_015369, partial [Termitomyces sp. Mi166